ncbi:MAG: AMP-binding protein [Pseudomonadota bacterium]
MEGCVYWPEEFVKEYKQKGYWEDKTIGEHLDECFAKYADRPALANSEGKTIVTYRQLGENVTKLAYQMAKMGIKTYDPVLFQMFNTPETLYLLYACFKLGAIPIASLVTHRWAELSFFAKMTDAKVHAIPAGVAQDFDFEEFADELRNEVSGLEFVLTTGKPSRPNMFSINELIEKEVDLQAAKKELAQYRPDPMEPAIFQLSGGTTGVPKIIPRTHNDYAYNVKCCAKRYAYNEETRFITPLPMTHNGPLVGAILPVHFSGGLIVLCAPKPQEMFAAIFQNKVNYLPIANVLVNMLMGRAPEEIKKNFGSVTKLWGSSIKPEALRSAMELLNCDSTQVFGMAEGVLTGTVPEDSLDVKLFTQGKGISEADEIRVVDLVTLKDLPPGEVGEMIFRGPYTIRGYYKAPERNKDAFTPDGFYRSGDLGKLDEQGNMTWMGRIKDCIDRGGEKVNAEEVELHVRAYSKVKDVAAVAMPDKKFGERICAFVIPKPNETLDLEEIRDFLINERKIAKFKAPERLEVTDAFPLTAIGKLDKKVLRQIIADKLKSEGEI